MRESQKRYRWGRLSALLMRTWMLLPAPLLRLLATAGFLLVMATLFPVGMAVALKVEKIKKDNDVHTYKEILAFSEGRRLDELDKAVEKGKRPYQALVAALSSALLTLLAAGGIALMYIAFRYLTRS